MSSWCTIESDPGVFTELIESFGTRDVQVEELYDLDPESLLRLESPIYGLIFLFKWTSDHGSESKDADTATATAKQSDAETQMQVDTDAAIHQSMSDATSNNSVAASPAQPPQQRLFFARQMINNACATQAILNILLNTQSSQVELGAELQNFRDFTIDLPADVRGLALGESDTIRRCHNSFRRPESFVFEESKDKSSSGDDDDVFHFVSYVHVANAVWELDGLREEPQCIRKQCSPQEWHAAALGAIQAKIARYATKEIRFNLMAVVKNRVKVYEQQIEELKQQKTQLESSDASATTDKSSTATATTLAELTLQLNDAQQSCDEEKSKRAKWHLENERRRFNYVPFIFQTLKLLAEKNKLGALVEKAAKASAERTARTRDRQQKQAELEKQEKATKAQPSTAAASPSKQQPAK